MSVAPRAPLRPEHLLAALGLVINAESDAHLAGRLQRLARRICDHLEQCAECTVARDSGVVLTSAMVRRPETSKAFCARGANLIAALFRAAAA